MTNSYRFIDATTIAVEIWDYKEQCNRDCLIDAADLDLINQHKGHWYANKVRGKQRKWYAQSKLYKATIGTTHTTMMHRIIMGTTDRLIEVDHRDNDGLNNRRLNLRECTHRENIRFRQPDKDWDAHDASHELADEYRRERRIADEIAKQFDLTRQALWCIRKRKTKTSPAALAYWDACDAEKCRPFWRIEAQHPVDGKKFGAVLVIPK